MSVHVQARNVPLWLGLVVHMSALNFDARVTTVLFMNLRSFQQILKLKVNRESQQVQTWYKCQLAIWVHNHDNILAITLTLCLLAQNSTLNIETCKIFAEFYTDISLVKILKPLSHATKDLLSIKTWLSILNLQMNKKYGKSYLELLATCCTLAQSSQ